VAYARPVADLYTCAIRIPRARVQRAQVATVLHPDKYLSFVLVTTASHQLQAASSRRPSSIVRGPLLDL
jgi:hypothetical protein